jgi:aspartate kinase
MALFVKKFGGTSVGSIERMRHIVEIVGAARKAGDEVVVVVSAMSGETDRLIHLLKQASDMPDTREYDVLVSTGEQVSMVLVASLLTAQGYPARSYTGAQAGIKTDQAHQKAHIIDVDPSALKKALAEGIIPVIAGFQGKSETGEITTLGRGGSDTTGVAIAAALGADECQIYTDVDGVYTADPRVVPAARLLPTITLEEMMEMAALGAKVLQNRSIRYAGRYKVPLRVLSSFSNHPGTLITYEEFNTMEKALISGLAFNRQEAKITLFGLPFRADLASRVMQPLAEANIDIDIILQNMTEDGKCNFTFTVNREEYRQALTIAEKLVGALGATSAQGDNKIAKLSIVGVGMRSHIGVANKMFTTLSNEGIAIQLISTSEIKISVLIEEKYLELGARALHTAFELDQKEATEEFDPVVVK